MDYDQDTGVAVDDPLLDENHWGAGQSTVLGPVDVVPRGRNETASEYLERMAKRTDNIARARRDEHRAARAARIAGWVREVITTAMQLIGLAAVSYGLFTFKPWVGIVCGGLSLILISVAIDPPKRRFNFRRAAPTPKGMAFVPGGGDQ